MEHYSIQWALITGHSRLSSGRRGHANAAMDLVSYILRKFSLVRGLERSVKRLEQSVSVLQPERDRLEAENRALSALRAESDKWTKFTPHGHFYSPLPSPAEVEAAFARGGNGPPIPGVELNTDAQFALMQELAAFYPDLPFPEKETAGHRYYLGNLSYGPYDACALYGVMRHLKPRRIVEVGCGYSSAALLDANDASFGGRIEFTFIDPDLAQLRRLLLPGEANPGTLIEKQVQDVPNDVFEKLEAGDILLIDTSHVSKVGSDVNHLLFKVLPALKPGVWVHIHDVTVNLEYPRNWFEEGRAWNELYLLRAFLMYNRAFSVMLSTALMYNDHWDFLKEKMPMCAAGGGGQLWLRKDSG
jgi:SAM-dependent methyltransferase